MQHDLTQGPITQTMLAFAAPMIAGNLLQPCYNIADTLIVGQFLGAGGQGVRGRRWKKRTKSAVRKRFSLWKIMIDCWSVNMVR